ncbi:MAG: hypothetical protein WA996_22450, partial [Candidatus Promineifilaceae bacterium]
QSFTPLCCIVSTSYQSGSLFALPLTTVCPEPATRLSLWNAAIVGQRLFMLQFSPELFRSGKAAFYKMRSLF